MNRIHKKSLSSIRRLFHSAYVIKPRTGALEQEKQACYLTKSLMIDGPPPGIEHENREEKDKMVEQMRNTIIETMYFQRDEPISYPKRMRERSRGYKLRNYKESLSSSMIDNLLRIIWLSQSARKPEVMETTFSYRPDVVSPWERIGHKIQVSGKHGHLISGRKLLKKFAEDATVKETCNTDVIWDDIISPFFDLQTQDTSYKPNRGFHPNSPFPCPQKLLMLNSNIWKPKHHFGQGLFYTFAHALAFALENGFELGSDLSDPIPMQYISFDGTSLYFVWFQLNTLNFDEDPTTIKNLAWKQELKLFDDVTEVVARGAERPTDYNEYTGKRMSLVDFDRKKLAETLDNEQTVQVGIYGYNREAASRLIDFMFYT